MHSTIWIYLQSINRSRPFIHYIFETCQGVIQQIYEHMLFFTESGEFIVCLLYIQLYIQYNIKVFINF